MPIELGTTDIDKIYLGATEVDKVYLGATEVFTKAAAAVSKSLVWTVARLGVDHFLGYTRDSSYAGFPRAGGLVPNTVPLIRSLNILNLGDGRLELIFSRNQTFMGNITVAGSVRGRSVTFTEVLTRSNATGWLGPSNRNGIQNVRAGDVVDITITGFPFTS